MAKLFLDGIFDGASASPSSVRITMPNYGGDGAVPRINLVGLMTGDVSFTAQNSWGTVINDLSNLQDLASLAGESNMFSWISASTMCWKGTSPLSIGIEFFLINYRAGLDLENKLKTLVKLAALAQDSSNSDYKTQVHGGYAPKLMKGNNDWFTIGEIVSAENLKDTVDNQGTYDTGNIEGNAKSALQLEFGHKSRIRNLLLSKIDVTESLVEVSDINGGNIKPLYYRVSAQFTGVRPLITKDVDDMFNF